ncbi:hypothetical protein [Burkholderia sp. BE17]|uniref:hypothetical protein n=1 Tax=Burkholderia sp. BE17 TaxID=2656644 RepID=UPI001D12A0D2|nr:hypothetical protein [Burkholderia sp. BE17]
MQIFHAHDHAHACRRAHVRGRHGTPQANGAPTRGVRAVRPTGQPASQPPLAPPGAEAAPGMLAPLSAPLPAAALPGMPDGAADGAADIPPVALDSELAAPPLSLFFWQPAPAARPAIRMPAKTARDT